MRTLTASALLAIFLLIFGCTTKTKIPPTDHPNSKNWPDLFNADLSNAVFPDSVWTVEDGVLTASKDQVIWSGKDYDNFILDLEFKTDPGTNSGVIVYCSNMDDWIPNSVEIQIADDYAEEWANSPKSWQCGAAFGHQPATKSMVKKPGEWNHYTITCVDNMIYVLLNGEQVNAIDLTKFTDAKVNPDGTEAPEWLSNPMASLPTHGRIGLQGKHAGAPIYFRNIKIKTL